MDRRDFRLICTALGFAVVVMQDGADNALTDRAQALAGLIESYCLTTQPDAVAALDVDQSDATGNLEVISQFVDDYRNMLSSEKSA
jgi:hypothetical protein